MNRSLCIRYAALGAKTTRATTSSTECIEETMSNEDRLKTVLAPPSLRIAERWHGVYVTHPTAPALVATPEPGVRQA